MIDLVSKLPGGSTTIFTIMSALAAEYNAINLGQGYPNFDCDQKLKDLVNHHLQNAKNQYCPMAGLPALREILSKKMRNTSGMIVDPSTDITIVAGATQALFTAITAFIHPGDEVILLEPAYDCYRPTVLLNGGIPIAYELEPPDFVIDWDRFGQLITENTRMIIINTPHNPIGKTLKSDDLLALQELVRDKNIIVLSDEVYEHLIYDGAVHQSVLRYPHLFEQSMAVYSFGKTFHNTGWKMGYCVAPDYLMSEFRKVHQWNVFCVNSFVQYGLCDYLQDPEPYLSLPDFYQSKRDYFNQQIKSSKFRAISSEGTYFQLFDYSSLSDLDDFSFAKQLTTEHGVAAIPLSVFYTTRRQDKLIRLCFAKTEDVLHDAAKLLSKI